MEEVNVEKTLTDIRERVRAQIRQQTSMASNLAEPQVPTRKNDVTLESLRANLSIIERSWNRLPPLTSYRRGPIARLELWLKRLFKKATHWFTWEQVNFNSANAKSMRDIIAVLSEHENELIELRRQLQKCDGNAGDGAPQQPERFGEQVVANGGSATDQPAARANESDITELARRIEELRAIRARHDIT
jgi:hypothetical protein